MDVDVKHIIAVAYALTVQPFTLALRGSPPRRGGCQSCLPGRSLNRLHISTVNVDRHGFLNQIDANDETVVFLFFDQNTFGAL